MERRGPKLNQTNVFRVRRDSQLSKGLFFSKLIVKKHGSIQIEGMGQCISLCFKLAQILSKNGLANIQKIQEANVEREGKRQIHPKIAITLTKSANFDKLTQGLVLRQN